MEKEAKVVQMRKQYKVYRSLFNKNKANDVFNDETAKIRPPFCSVITNADDNFSLKRSASCITLASRTPFIPYGDS